MSEKTFPARVVKIIDSERIVINKGFKDGIKKGQKFLIYSFGEEIFDPETKDSLGTLEYSKGQGEVDHVQEKMATLISCQYEYQEEEIAPNSITAIAMFGFGGSHRRKIENRLPFGAVEISDFAKPI